MTYEEKLLDPRWQRKRLEIFQRDNFTCVCCGRNDLTLHIHHIVYINNSDPWDYPNEKLVTYCEKCHESEHLIGKDLNENLIDLIREKPMFLRQVAQACILIEKWPPFAKSFKYFMNQELESYLKSRENG